MKLGGPFEAVATVSVWHFVEFNLYATLENCLSRDISVILCVCNMLSERS